MIIVIIIVLLFILFYKLVNKRKDEIVRNITKKVQETTKKEKKNRMEFMKKILILIFILSIMNIVLFGQDLQINIKYKVMNGKVYFYGNTNLPDNTKLGIFVNNSEGYQAQDYDILVKNGKYKSTGFTENGEKLKGKFNVKLTSYFNKFWQSKDLLKKLNLFKGNNIKKSENFGKEIKTIELSKPIQIKEKKYDNSFKGINYKIIEKSNLRNLKGSIVIRLEKKVTNDFLKELALKLRKAQPREYDRLFIEYYLPKMTPGSGAWATSHFNPNLEVRILGITIEKENALKSNNISKNGKIIGQWIDRQLSVKEILIKRNGKYILIEQYSDGSSHEIEMVKSKMNGKVKIEERSGNDFGEYYLIEKNGNMGIYDNYGLIREFQKIK